MVYDMFESVHTNAQFNLGGQILEIPTPVPPDLNPIN